MPVQLPRDGENPPTIRQIQRGEKIREIRPAETEGPKHSRRITSLDILTRFGWLIVAGAALIMSAYSLYWVGRHYGVPPVIAGMISVIFDGAAVISCDLALKYARSHDSGFAPRMVVFLAAAASAYLNAQHAILDGLPRPAVVLFSSPPIIAVIMLELHTRFTKRAAMKRAGRVPAALPIIGRTAWVLFPIRSYRTIRRIVGARLRMLETQAGVSGTLGEVSGSIGNSADSSPKPQVVRAWARLQGISVPERGPLPHSVTTAYILAITTAETPRETHAGSNGHVSRLEIESEKP